MGVVFTYMLPRVVTDANPKRGLIGGGESVMITGRDVSRPQLDESTFALWGGGSRGRWKSKSLIQCVTPTLTPGKFEDDSGHSHH